MRYNWRYGCVSQACLYISQINACKHKKYYKPARLKKVFEMGKDYELDNSESFNTVFQFLVLAGTFNLYSKNLFVNFESLYFPEQ